MFTKKDIVVIVLASVCIFTVGFMAARENRVDSICMSEKGRPGIVGLELLDHVKEVDERYKNGEIETLYTIEMVRADDVWRVALTGQNDYDDYVAFGIYDHIPTEKDFMVLWANRMLDDEMDELMDNYFD